MEYIESKSLRERYKRFTHSSGLRVCLYPMEGYSTAYVLFATKYGSVDNAFKSDGDSEFSEVPAGIAHFLEHKLFENEEGDAFALYSKTGASANAYTNFDRTAYLFGCTDNFAPSLDILLDFVSRPYFTKESVEKEQGIIAQELTMFEDNPDWKVLFNLLGALYHHHPVKIDIGGTLDSIKLIDHELLYKCYHTFYNLGNMVLSIAGNFSEEDVYNALDRHLKQSPPLTVERMTVDEPREVVKKRTEQTFEVAMPYFNIGFKAQDRGHAGNLRAEIFMEILSEAVLGQSTPLYNRLYEEGLINATFDCETLAGTNYLMSILSGESKDPDKLYAIISDEFSGLIKDGIAAEELDRALKVCYGHAVRAFGSVEAVASIMLTSEFASLSAFDVLDFMETITHEQLLLQFSELFNPEYSALSVIQPKQ